MDVLQLIPALHLQDLLPRQQRVYFMWLQLARAGPTAAAKHVPERAGLGHALPRIQLHLT